MEGSETSRTLSLRFQRRKREMYSYERPSGEYSILRKKREM